MGGQLSPDAAFLVGRWWDSRRQQGQKPRQGASDQDQHESGHDFSRANKANEMSVALATEG